MLIAFNKPFGVICKFRPEPGRATLADYIEVPDVYPAGRLDTDSEGLLLLTDDGVLQARIANPRHKLAKVYWAQVEGVPTAAALTALSNGVDLGDFTTQPAGARIINEPTILWPRDPPIRYRAKIPTTWLELTLREGKNRQVRRMTARVGFPTLRLVRVAVGLVSVESLAHGSSDRAASVGIPGGDDRAASKRIPGGDGLAPGTWRKIDPASPWTGR